MADAKIFFITGTDTGVGKTVFASRLTQALREHGVRVVALKPVCSGGRADALELHKAAGGVLSLDEVNPWHYRAALSPLVAARKEGKRLKLAQVVKQVRSVVRRFEVVIVEGAGGLLSPLGEDFDSRDLALALKANILIVASNRLGAVGQVRLVLEALPLAVRNRAEVILMNPKRADAASRTNAELLEQFIPAERVRMMGWIKQGNR